MSELAAEAWDAFVSVDGKVASTLRLLLARPGALTVEYLSGRRARFIPPLRLYLLCSLLFFLVDSIPQPKSALRIASEARADSVTRARRLEPALLTRKIDSINALPRSWMWRRMQVQSARVSNDGKNFTTDFKTQIPRVLFVLVPAFAGLLGLAYRKRRRSYAAHLIVSLHLHSFAFLALTAGVIIGSVPIARHSAISGWFVLAWIAGYIPLTFRRVYGGGIVPATLRATALFALYSTIGLAVMATLGILLVFLY